MKKVLVTLSFSTIRRLLVANIPSARLKNLAEKLLDVVEKMAVILTDNDKNNVGQIEELWRETRPELITVAIEEMQLTVATKVKEESVRMVLTQTLETLKLEISKLEKDANA